ncbi:hypothetical protein [Streptomyces sp. NPDC006863]|uniref:hypothetical protein n=1 Tax=Streptomyces sp. NPDC006863 TaxID=3154779 RepID=UPI0033F05E7C
MTTTETTTGITISPLPENWAPPAEWLRATRPVDDNLPDEEWEDTGYQAGVSFILDTERRELSALPLGRGASLVEMPATYVTYEHIRAGVAPTLMLLGGMHLSTSVDLATPARINAVLNEVRPLAQQIVDNLLPVTGTSSRDWTARAGDALSAAGHLVDRYPYRGTEYDFPFRRRAYLLDAGLALDALPSLVNPAWAEATDQQLQDAAVNLKRRIEDHFRSPEALETLIALSLTGARLPDEDDGTPVQQSVLYGARAWLHAYRHDQADGLTPMDAARWDGAVHHAPFVTDDMTDAELEAVARRAERDAASQGVKLLGAEQWALTLRADRRRVIRAQLAELGTTISQLEADLKPARKRRTVLVTRVLGWGEEDTDSGLGRACGLSHTAVGTIRSSLDAEGAEGS